MKAIRELEPNPRPPTPLTLPDGSRCNHHVLRLGARVKQSLMKSGITAYQFGTAAVSDGISMGTFGMSYSLQSREVIADSVETVAGGHWLDGMVTLPACDKNMRAYCSEAVVVLLSVVRRQNDVELTS